MSREPPRPLSAPHPQMPQAYHHSARLHAHRKRSGRWRRAQHPHFGNAQCPQAVRLPQAETPLASHRGRRTRRHHREPCPRRGRRAPRPSRSPKQMRKRLAPAGTQSPHRAAFAPRARRERPPTVRARDAELRAQPLARHRQVAPRSALHHPSRQAAQLPARLPQQAPSHTRQQAASPPQPHGPQTARRPAPHSGCRPPRPAPPSTGGTAPEHRASARLPSSAHPAHRASERP